MVSVEPHREDSALHCHHPRVDRKAGRQAGRQEVTMEGGGKAAETVVVTFIAPSDGRDPHQNLPARAQGLNFTIQ